jgi:tetratricopeptide (TPR) repeat protein
MIGCIVMRFISNPSRLLLVALLPMVWGSVGAQSVTVLGNGAAQNCYHAALTASQVHVTSREDIKQCTTALEHTALSLRDRAATFVNRGVVYLAEEEYQLALEDFEAAARLKEDFGEIYVNRGNLYFMGRSFEKAIDEYSRAIRLGLNKEHVAFLNRGMAYEHLKDIENAEADYRRALEILPEWSMATKKLEKLLQKYPPS